MGVVSGCYKSSQPRDKLGTGTQPLQVGTPSTHSTGSGQAGSGQVGTKVLRSQRSEVGGQRTEDKGQTEY